MVQIENITYQYSRKLSPVFRNFSLQIPSGKICGLLGKNGAGKSTLLYLISGLLKSNSGKVSFLGNDMARRQASSLQDLFIVPEEFELPDISLEKFLRVNTVFYPHFDEELLRNCLADFEMDMSMNLDELSMGQKKKVFICFALATGVKLLLLDEPTNGMDIPSKSQFRKTISRAMTDERTILISTHQVKDVEFLLDQIIILDNNRVLLNEEMAAIQEKLSFQWMSSRDVPESAIYVQPTVSGRAVVMPNTTGEATQMDLEMLFNAVIARPEEMLNLFKK